MQPLERVGLWVCFPSCAAHYAKFVMSFSWMLREQSACLLLFLLYFDSFFMSQKFFTTKSHITKMLSGIIALCMAKKGNTTGSECYFQLFARDMVKPLPAGLTAPVIVWLLSYHLLFSRVFHADATIHPDLCAENYICDRTFFTLVSVLRQPLICLFFFMIIIQLFVKQMW